MIRRSSQPLAVWFLACDLAVTALAWVGAYRVRFGGWLPVRKDTPDFSLCLYDLPLVLLLGAVAYRLAGQYLVHRLRRFREEMAAVAKGSALLSLFVMASTFYTHDPYESRATMVLFTVLTASGTLAVRRLTWEAIRKLRRRGYNASFALIVGTGRVARKTARGLRRAGWMGIRTAGFVEDNPTRWTSDLPILGTTADLPRLVEKHRIEHVFI